MFIPFGIYTAADCEKPKRDFIPSGVDFILDEIVGVDTDKRIVECEKGKYDYDYLIVATGCQPVPNEVEGLEDWKPDPKANEHTSPSKLY